ncbi:hypothetical protein VHARVF571_580125 [Vibrio harveyi]|nr:hypothetical protein VHARVF571_580125 [Vibrio harveyi]
MVNYIATIIVFIHWWELINITSFTECPT